MISYADTNELENIAKEISFLASDLATELNSLFNRLSSVPTDTKEWVGTQADFYFAKVETDKKQYIDIVDKIKEFSRELNSEIVDIREAIKTNNN